MKHRVRTHSSFVSAARVEGTAAFARVEFLEDRRLMSVALAAEDALAQAFRAPVSARAEATAKPSIRSTTPAAGATNVDPVGDIIAYVNLPNEAGVTADPTIIAANVRLYRAGDYTKTPIPVNVNTTGAGDAIVLTPKSPLLDITEYQFEVLGGLTDQTGATFTSFSMRFTTGVADTGGPSLNVEFEQVTLPTAGGKRFTGITMGPDGKIYAGTMDGEIVRFDVLPDGTLGAPTVISTIIANNGGLPRIVTGLRFGPSSTSASNMELWVTHGEGLEINASDFTGKLSRLSGPNLELYQDFVTDLPRSVRDHLTQQMDFGPDKALYISQGSNSSMGEPDNAWGQRAEVLLSASVLRVNLLTISKSGQPLSVRTDGANGTTPYDPFAPGAAVTLYATGLRNAFDLLWHSNGHLYAPTNGSAPGGNTPAGPGVPALTNVGQNQPDPLFDIKKGKYYGHPNPLREEYVLNGGNPTGGVDPLEVIAYKVGTKPDANWDKPVYNFGDNRSPNGTIEYRSNNFFGALKGAMIVTEYSGGNDLVVIKPNADGSIEPAKVYRGMPGTTGLVDPLDLVENRANGNLYVVEYGANRITLLRAKNVAPQAPRNIGRAVFNDPVDGTSGSPVRTLTLKNPHAVPITITTLELIGDNEDSFTLVDVPTTPFTLQPDEKFTVKVQFDPAADAPLGVETAVLRFNSAEPVTIASLELSLRGLATSGATEPSLQRIFDLFQLADTVGDNDPATAEMILPLASPNDVLDVQALTKAGTGPVRMELMSVFAPAGSPTIRFGYYDAAGSQQTEVLTVNDNQRTVPSAATGGLTFDPGTGVFGLFTSAAGTGTTAFSEDRRNTFEPNAALRRKALFFPLKDAEGVVVPDAMVVAFEDSVGGTAYQDFVAVLRNVRSASAPPPAPEITVTIEGADVTNGATVDFGSVPKDAPSPQKQITIRNDGNVDLQMGAINLPPGFSLAEGLSTTSLAPGASDTITVVMLTAAGATNNAAAGISSSDSDEGTFALQFTGTVVASGSPTPTPTPTPTTPTPTPVPTPTSTLAAEVTGGLPAVVVAGTKSARGTAIVTIANPNFTGFSGKLTIAVAARDTGVSASADDSDAPTVLAVQTKNFKIAPNSGKPVKVKLKIPATLSQGDKQLMVTVTNILDGTTANAAGGAFRVEPPTVDLVGDPATGSAGFLVFGKRAKVPLSIRNNGNVATASTPVTFDLLVSTTPDGANPVYQTTVSGKLKVNANTTKRAMLGVTFPTGSFAAGNYFLVLRPTAALNISNGQTLATLSFGIS
jgi:glucose/arabinose dehydrogenase